jgi:hypothetical protein
VVPADGAFSVEEYLARDLPEVATWFRVLPYEKIPDMQEFPRGTYVWAGLDQLVPGMLRLVTVLHRDLAAAGGVRFLNHPTNTLRRFHLLDRLHKSGRNNFRAIRVGDDMANLRYPVFLRGERSHGGNVSSLLHSPPEIERAIGKAVLQGHSRDDLLVVEFCSVADPDGSYRKYSAFKVGSRILARSMERGQHWMVKLSHGEFTRELAMEEREYMVGNPHADVLDEVFRMAQVEYGRIDYSFQDGQLRTWEINLNATIGRGVGPGGGMGSAEVRAIRDEAREYFFDRFREAWREVDSEAGDAPPVRVEFDRTLIQQAHQRRRRGSRVLAAGRSLLRPAKPIIEPLMDPIIRWLGRTAGISTPRDTRVTK